MGPRLRKTCNNQKRNDDQQLTLAENGWESFLSHDGSRCAPGCRTCAYWRGIWPEETRRQASLAEARRRVSEFQQPYLQFVRWSASARGTLREKIEALYRDCQRFATEEIGKLVAEVGLQFDGEGMIKSND